MNEEELMERILWMEKRQEILSKHVSQLQKALLGAILDKLEETGVKPSALSSIFNTFYQREHRKVVEMYGGDLIEIASKNSAYYKKLIESDGVEVVFSPIRAKAQRSFFDTFGITTDGTLTKGGYLDSLLKNEMVKMEVTQFVYRANAGKFNKSKFRKGLETLITDTETPGIITSYYNKHVIETYQVADRQLGQDYADALGFEAFIYAGGTIKTTREFCQERNGKVILRSETKEWENMRWKGKNTPYVPLINLGGHGCRHACNWLNNKMALARRSDLYEDENGKLRVRQAA